MLEKLKQLERGTLIRINDEEYVRDTKTNSTQLTWFKLKDNKEYTDEQIVELIEKYF